MKTVTYEEILQKKSYILIDARTPQEFLHEGIPGAVNIPVLLDDERANVGTSYKQVSQEEAKKLGIDFISKRLPEIFQEVNKLSKQYKNLYFYCARGGMRSGTLASLFSALGYNVGKLDGGYHSYRKYILDELPKLNEGVKYFVLHGKTGVGKTKLLQGLEQKGYSVLDLEKFADHKGSFFGGLCEKREQSQKRFESLLFDFFKTNSPKYVIAESESKRIGNVYVPDCIYNSLLDSTHLLAQTTTENRVNIVMEDYSNTSHDAIKECILKVQRYAPQEFVEKLLLLLEQNDLREISRILMVDYYDGLYQKSINKYDFDLDLFYETVEEGIEKLDLYFVEKLSFSDNI